MSYQTSNADREPDRPIRTNQKRGKVEKKYGYRLTWKGFFRHWKPHDYWFERAHDRDHEMGKCARRFSDGSSFTIEAIER